MAFTKIAAAGIGSTGTVTLENLVVTGSITASLTGTATTTTNIPNLTGAITSNNTTTSLGSFSSANLATALSDKTGSGAAVFATSPVLVTPSLGIAIATSINASGIITATQLSTGASGTGVNITTDTISGPATLTIDPAAVGDNTGAVRIKGDLYVDGTQFIVNSTTIELADFRIGIGTTATSDELLNGAGIGIGSASNQKTLTWNNSSTALKSSEDFDVASGKVYKIAGNSVLSNNTLGSGILTSSLTSVGTLGSLSVSGASTFTSAGDASSGSLNLTSVDPFIRYTISGGTANQSKWDVRAYNNSGGYFTIRTINDANTVFTERLTIQASTGNVTATTFVGALTGNAATATTATNQSGGTVSATTGTFSGIVTGERYKGNNSLVLNTYTTVNPASNVFLYSQPNDRDSWIYLDSADTGSNWGIYHRQIDTTVSSLPGNSIGFIGGGTNTLQAYISLASGDAYFAGNLGVGDVSPTAKLQVTTSSSDGNVLTWGTGQVVISPGGTSTSQGLGFSVDTTGGISYLSSLTPGVVWNSMGYRALSHSFYYNGSSFAATIDSSGNVGIGTINPTSKLDVNGTVTATAFSGALTGTASSVTTNANLTGHVTSVGNAAVLGSFTSANLSAALTDETGTGSAVFATNPTFSTSVGIGTIIDIIPYDTLNSGTLSFEASAGQLFSITNNLTSGSIFSVNDVSGIPSIDVNANGTILLGAYGGNIGIGTINPTAKLDIGGGLAYNAGTYQAPLVSVSGGYLSIKSQTADGVARLTLIGDSATGDGTIDWGGNGNFNLKFTNNGNERARFDGSGNFLVGGTSSTVWNGGTTKKVLVLTNTNASAANAIFSGQTNSTTVDSGGIFEGYATSVTAGSKALGSIAFLRENTSNTALSSYTGFYTNNAGTVSEKARIDSSGRLLVGTTTTSSTTGLLVEGAGGAAPGIIRACATTATPGDGDVFGYLVFGDSAHSDAAWVAAARDGGTWSGASKPTRLVFSTTADGASSPTERMRITNTGSVTLLGATSNAAGTHSFQDNGASPNTVRLYNTTDSNNDGNNFLICDAAASVLRAAIRSNGGLANYSANNANLSDRNVKKDIALAADTWDCIKEWEIVNYRYKDQPDNADLNLGVIAQQVAESCPELITIFQEAKDATEDKPAQEERLGVKEQQMYWMAIKALQEAMKRIETLETEVAALKTA